MDSRSGSNGAGSRKWYWMVLNRREVRHCGQRYVPVWEHCQEDNGGCCVYL